MVVEKMPAVFKYHEFRFGVGRDFIDQFSQIRDRAEFVAVAVNEQDRFAQIFEKPEIVVFIDRRSNPYQTDGARVGDGGLASDPRPQPKTGERDLVLRVIYR